ncbi:MAG: radical SAM protein, partial [Candidatus Thorarchaeota archaeon]
MDPYICPEALDRNNKFYSIKKKNLEMADRNYSNLSPIINSSPAKVIVQTTEACNLSCIFCQIGKTEKGRHMNIQIFDIVVDQLFPTLVEMHPTNIGEPLMWPHFGYMCEKMEEYGVLLDLTTNGTLFNENNIDHIENIARDIKISFDGAKKETFESLRKGAKYDSVIGNIESLVQRIKGKPHRTISLQMTLMMSNYQELPDLIDLASKLGVDKVKGYHLFSF